ncbi:DUF3800 domain-containing protein [Lysinibacillus varians]|uniref:DUF3800 domain-containing protein n=1 Tax=Lysinibacillus varians TaxID=1145276 RepID=A0ABY2TJL5_9BACI|nr:DUF3800 domain-containing protein [Lysinibacillus varians]AHN24500.1 hypothetical protein T479_20775 [Lysinibacillus varians]TKI67043.1 hypothetical protein FC752_03145 [Lysinibacillus varians]
MDQLTAYIDESGNSGVKIFSGGDKFHWVGVMLSSCDVDSTLKRIIKLAQTEGFNELHGGELGLTRLNRLADSLIELYEELDVTFVFTRVEREHVATMKFVDLVFDPENNEAVPSEMYNIEFFRLMTALSVAKTLTNEHRRRFWDVLSIGEKGVPKFVELMQDIKEHALDNDEFIYEKDLFCEIFDYAATNPIQILELDILSKELKRIQSEGITDEFDDVYRNNAKYRSANLATFNMSVDALHKVLMDNKKVISRVVHDEQTEFDKQLKNAFALTSKVTVTSDPFEYSKAGLMETFSGDIEFINSSQNAGVQLIDVALWIMKKVNDSEVELTDRCAVLYDAIVKRAYFNGFWLDKLVRTLYRMVQEKGGID